MSAPCITTEATPLSERAIGVFDSGVGGLSVLREIHRALPFESLCYVADSAHAPYGEKSADWIQRRSESLIDFLRQVPVKAVVVACNTITGLAIGALRERFPGLPLVAIEPAVKPAAALTHNGVIGVLATRQTVASPGLARLIAQYASQHRMLLQACPGWVERVEQGALNGPETARLVRERVEPLLQAGVDTLVLGCTHYPFLLPLIRDITGPDVNIIDPAAAVARELKRRLDQSGLRHPATDLATPILSQPQFWTSGSAKQAREVLSQLWAPDTEVCTLPEVTM